MMQRLVLIDREHDAAALSSGHCSATQQFICAIIIQRGAAAAAVVYGHHCAIILTGCLAGLGDANVRLLAHIVIVVVQLVPASQVDAEGMVRRATVAAGLPASPSLPASPALASSSLARSMKNFLLLTRFSAHSLS